MTRRPGTAPISVLVPTWNEDRNLEACLESVRFCDQVVVVDSDSQDGTLEIARAAGAEIHQFAYSGGWPKKRQWAMEHLELRNPWTLLLDADERVGPELRRELERISLRAHGPDGYWIPARVIFLGREIRFGPGRLRKLCLFRTGRGRFERRLEEQDASMGDMEVHEHILLDGREATLTACLIHENRNGLDRYIQKHNQYSNWSSALYHRLLTGEQVDREARPARLLGNQSERRRWWKRVALGIPGSPVLIFLYLYLLRFGFLDGRAGLDYCLFQGIQHFNIKVKLDERRSR